MTEEERERIRWALELAQKACHGHFCDLHPMGQAEVCKATTDAISLIDSQAAEGDLIPRKEVVARIEQQIRLWNNDTVTMACADMLADLKQLPASHPATAQCVEKVRVMEIVHQDNCAGPLDCTCGAENARQQIYFELKALPPEQVEQEKRC